jgi:hypothetical protein
MVTHGKGQQAADQRLKGNVMLSRKSTLRQYENVTVNLMIEFYLDESDHVQEAQRLMSLVETITQMAKQKWS